MITGQKEGSALLLTKVLLQSEMLNKDLHELDENVTHVSA